MVPLLMRAPVLIALAVCAVAASGQEGDDRHQWTLRAELGIAAASSALDAWTEGGLGKLRYGEDESGIAANRAVASYRGRIKDGLWARAVVDYVADASSGLDLTEAYLEWRPIPTSRNRHQLKFGAFYPPLSLENGGEAWSSPYTLSYSAINTWFGEEIRPVGIEWSARRRVGFAGSAHELKWFAAGFYGNDPVGTLLFWRGWAVHDRQSRLSDRLTLPPMPIWDGNGNVIGVSEQTLKPFQEIDDRPGYYLGAEWRFARRVLLQLAHYDNRADPERFAGGQWGWETRFSQLAAQVSLPWGIGAIAQWLKGGTYWIAGGLPTGETASGAKLVEDSFEANFLLLTRAYGRHRVSVRYDHFEIVREEAAPALRSDAGHAWTLAYRHQRPRLAVDVEWLAIRSIRELRALFYDLPVRATERQLRIQVAVMLGSDRCAAC